MIRVWGFRLSEEGKKKQEKMVETAEEMEELFEETSEGRFWVFKLIEGGEKKWQGKKRVERRFDRDRKIRGKYHLLM